MWQIHISRDCNDSSQEWLIIRPFTPLWDVCTAVSWCSKAATGAPGASMKLDKEDPAESVGNPVTLDFGCWLSFSESAKTRKVPLRIQFSQIFNMSTHCRLVLWVLTCVVRLWRCRRGWPIAWWSPRTWQNCWQRLGFCQQLSTRCSARLNCFFPWLFWSFLFGYVVISANSWWEQKTCPAFQCLTACLYTVIRSYIPESEEKHLILRAASRKQLQKTLGQLRRIALESQTWIHDTIRWVSLGRKRATLSHSRARICAPRWLQGVSMGFKVGMPVGLQLCQGLGRVWQKDRLLDVA